MPRNSPYSAHHYHALIDAIKQSGETSWKARLVSEFIGCSPNNLSTRMNWALEHGLMHRLYHGRYTHYAIGPNPEAPQFTGHPALADVDGFIGCLCSDGELHLYGLPDANDDGSVTLNTFQRRALVEILQSDPEGSDALSGRPMIDAMAWTDGELVLLHLPQADADSAAVILSNAERRLLRALLVKP